MLVFVIHKKILTKDGVFRGVIFECLGVQMKPWRLRLCYAFIYCKPVSIGTKVTPFLDAYSNH